MTPVEPRLLRAGPVTAVLEEGALRDVRIGDTEVVRGVYAAVRDATWGTVAPVLSGSRVEAGEGTFSVRFVAEHREGDIDFVWEATIEGSHDGTVRFVMDGVARGDFLRSRIGFCVLHPMELAGLPVEVTTPDGVVRGAFPERISAHQPFCDIVALRHAAGAAVEVELAFEGDLFEMEDQRNWTDASYKTYCTPLHLPWPVAVHAGDRVRQAVVLRVRGEGRAQLRPAARAMRDAHRVQVGEQAVGPLPPLGLGAASDGRSLTPAEAQRLREVSPAHLRVELDLTNGRWGTRLEAAARDAEALDCALELEVRCGPQGEGLDELAGALGERVTRVFCFDASTHATTEPIAAAARRLLDGVAIGGGTRGHFAELNRADPPLGLLDVVGYSITPQVHAFDTRSIIETLPAQAVTVDDARALTGLPVAVGPVTLLPRFNAAVAGPRPPPPPDPRQASGFGAAWTVGSIAALASARADALTYYETVGGRGLLDGDDVFPVFGVFADLAPFAGGAVLPVDIDAPLAVTAVAVRDDSRLLVLVANLTDREQRVELVLPSRTDRLTLRPSAIARVDEIASQP